MAHVAVTINGRSYEIACDDGQEGRLTALAAYVNHRVGELVANVGQVGEARLLVMASLLIADELSDARAGLTTMENDSEAQAAEALDRLADRVEVIARRLQPT